MPDNLENRLDHLGEALAADAPVLEESSDFLRAVRRRGNVRAFRGALVAGSGIALVAAALVLAAVLNPPRSIVDPIDDPNRGPFVAVDDGMQSPTILALSRAAFGSGNTSRLPSANGSGASGTGESWRAGSALSAERTDELLSGL